MSTACIVGRSCEWIDAGDLDPVGCATRGDRSIEVDAHVPEVADESKSSRLEHRRRGAIPGVDRLAELRVGNPSQQLAGSLLDPVQEDGAESLPSLGGMHESPGVDDVGSVAHGVRVGDDRPGIVDHDPRIGGEVES